MLTFKSSSRPGTQSILQYGTSLLLRCTNSALPGICQRLFKIWNPSPVARRVWLVMISIFSVVASKRSDEMAVVYYAATLTLAGLAMMLASCLLVEFQPRYTLPRWELTIISTKVLFARSMERCLDPGRKSLAAGPGAGDQEQSRSRING
jgi:hypothetical protein